MATRMNNSKWMIGGALGVLVLAVASVLLMRPETSGRDDASTDAPRQRHERTLAQKDDPVDAVRDSTRLWKERIESARRLPLALDDKEMETMLAYLRKPLPASGRENELLAINEVMEQLRSKGRGTAAYGAALASLIRDPDAEPVVRDYAVQHAVQWMKEDANNEHQDEDGADRKLLLDAIAVLLTEPGGPGEASGSDATSWGTALNSLRDLKLARAGGEDVNQMFAGISPLVLEVASGEARASAPNRIAAIHCLPDLPDRAAARVIARQLVIANESATALPAVATLGSLGDSRDVALLGELAQTEGPLRFAAASSLKRLQQHLASGDQF